MKNEKDFGREAEALNGDELDQVTGGRIVIDREDISGAESGSGSCLVLDGTDPHDAEERRFPSSDNGLEDTGDVNKRLGL